MQKTIRLREGTLVYELQRKRVKRVSLRVRADGSVCVSAPSYVPLALIEQFLLSRQDWVRERRERALGAIEEQRRSLRDGGLLYDWGEPLRLRLRQAGRRAVERRGDELWLCLRDPADEEAVRRALEAWRKAGCEKTITALCRELYPAFAARGVAFPRLGFRRMKSRWGSCRPRQGALSFNTRLAELPVACAEYVVAHEFAHFLQPNHSPAFYDEVARVLPDWQARRALLRAWEKQHPM